MPDLHHLLPSGSMGYRSQAPESARPLQHRGEMLCPTPNGAGAKAEQREHGIDEREGLC
jgi:hypothetical protein